MVSMVTSSLSKVAYIFTYQLGIFSTYLDKSCEFSVEFIIWMSKVQHRPLSLSSFRVDLFP